MKLVYLADSSASMFASNLLNTLIPASIPRLYSTEGRLISHGIHTCSGQWSSHTDFDWFSSVQPQCRRTTLLAPTPGWLHPTFPFIEAPPWLCPLAAAEFSLLLLKRMAQYLVSALCDTVVEYQPVLCIACGRLPVTCPLSYCQSAWVSQGL